MRFLELAGLVSEGKDPEVQARLVAPATQVPAEQGQTYCPWPGTGGLSLGLGQGGWGWAYKSAVGAIGQVWETSRDHSVAIFKTMITPCWVAFAAPHTPASLNSS